MNNIICMKWGTKYGPEYVNNLYSMVARNLTLPFRFVCFTDNGEGVREEVEVMPLPEMDLPDGAERGWRKLSTFKEDFPLDGKILFIDLDTVIVDNIDDFFNIGGDFFMIKHWAPSEKHGKGESAVYRYNSKIHHEIYDYFMSHIDEVKNNFRHEQAFLTDWMEKRNKLAFWPDAWTPSFKYNCMSPFPVNFIKQPLIPEGAKMIIFHGNPTPSQAKEGKVKGIKKFLRFIRPVAWIDKHWR